MLNSMLKIFVGPVMGGGGLNPHQPPRKYAPGCTCACCFRSYVKVQPHIIDKQCGILVAQWSKSQLLHGQLEIQQQKF
jgi:hypothetical protein